MLLREYLNSKNMSQAAFASIINTTQAAVGRYALGDRTPDLELVVKIEEVTGGEVSYRDILEAERLRKAEIKALRGKRVSKKKRLNTKLINR
jgi:transcriptional regulator with XRE-family HTH domain